MLNKFVQAKSEEIKRIKEMERSGIFPLTYKYKKIKLSNILKKKNGIIAEYKVASPSLGIINKNLSPLDVISGYVKNGAVGISVITEKKYFHGDLNFLNELREVNLPILRKDFIIDPIQIKYTATTPASAVLIIVKLFKDNYENLLKLIDYCYLLNLDPVVEINDINELDVAKKSGAKVLLVNNRNLDTLKVDVNTSKKLIEKKQNSEIWISASGLCSPKDAIEMLSIGYDACLIGTYFMKQNDPAKTLGEFVKKIQEIRKCY